MSDDAHPFAMAFDIRMIEQLGLRLYQTLPPVISELVSNAWDADAGLVEIEIPTGPINSKSKISVKDNGMGMSKEDLNKKYLFVGRCRRENGPIEFTPKGRKVMGRKGIGKLSVFGVTDKVTVESRKDKKINAFTMSLNDIRNTKSDKYYPVPHSVDDNGADEREGTTITLSDLNRTKKINIDEIRIQLAKRFSILSSEFVVKINGTPLIGYLDSIKKDIEGKIYEFNNEKIDEKREDLRVDGWIATTKKPFNDPGIFVMAHGKMVQEPFFFSEPMGRHYAFSYMVGVINADFLDEEEEDITATDRRSIAWDSNPEAEILMGWGKSTIGNIRAEWDKNRVKVKRRDIFENEKLEQWYVNRGKVERELIDELIEKIVDSEVHDDKLIGLVEAMSERFDYYTYKELADRFRETPPKDFEKIMSLVNEWAFIEANNTMKIISGRLEMIETLENYVRENEYEKTIQEHLYRYPWLIHPTYISWEKETTLTKLLLDNFPEKYADDGRKRVDLICLGTGSDIYVIELKRPIHVLDYEDLTQMKRYVAFIKKHCHNPVTDIGISPPIRVFGYLIGGQITDDPLMTNEVISIERNGEMAISMYHTMIDRAKRLHKEFIDNLQETTDKSIKEGKINLGKREKKGNLKDFQ